MSEGRGWLTCAVIGVVALVGAKSGAVLLTGVAMPVDRLLDQVLGLVDRRAREQVRTLCGCIDKALASIARGRDPGAVASARLTTERLLADFGLSDAEFTALDLDPEKAAREVLSHTSFTTDERHEIAPLCRGLLVCFYDTLPDNPELLAEFLPHIHRATLARLTQIRATQDAHSRQLDAILAKVSEQAGIPLATLRSILEGFGEQIAELDAFTIESKLRAKADDYRELTARLQRLTNADPRVQELRGEAKRLLDQGDFAGADGRLAEARDLSLTAATEARQHYASLLETAAEFEAERAQAAGLRSDHEIAAVHWAEAARIVAPLGADASWRYLLAEATALRDHGYERGENVSLLGAIERYQSLLTVTPKPRRATDWARTQNSLGNALSMLGERESVSGRLNEAVSAYRAALTERTRESVPLEWAATQNDLGNALLALGERESGTARLEEAVAAYRAALEERTRKRVPLDWATTQNTLGNALQVLGQRERGTKRLEEAMEAYGAALEVRTRECAPVHWAATQNNIGNVLSILGQRERGTKRLEEAVEAYRAVLGERDRERVPLDWAGTQHNLGNALLHLGERKSGTERLEEAAEAYRAALEERIRKRVPLDWAHSQHGLARVLGAIAQRRHDGLVMEQAIALLEEVAEVYRRGTVSYWLAKAEDRLTRMRSEMIVITSVSAVNQK